MQYLCWALKCIIAIVFNSCWLAQNCVILTILTSDWCAIDMYRSWLGLWMFSGVVWCTKSSQYWYRYRAIISQKAEKWCRSASSCGGIHSRASGQTQWSLNYRVWTSTGQDNALQPIQSVRYGRNTTKATQKIIDTKNKYRKTSICEVRCGASYLCRLQPSAGARSLKV